MNIKRLFRLSEGETRAVRFLSGLHVNLEEGKTSSWVTVTRAGTFTDPRYGTFSITRDMLMSMVKNFDGKVYGQDIFIDVAHKPDNGAAGEIKRLTVEGDRLRALIEWTPFGVDSIRSKSFRYLSAEYRENYTDNEAGKDHGPLLLGAALTTRPVIKRLEPIQLSEDPGTSRPTLLHPELTKQLKQECKAMKTKFLALLATALASCSGLTEAATKTLTEAFDKALDAITEEEQAKLLLASFESTGKKLAEELGKRPGAPITLSIETPGGNAGLNAEAVKKIIADANAANAESAKQLTESRDAKVAQFTKMLTDAEGLDENVVKQLAEDGAELITADMSDEQIKRFAEHELKQARQLSVASQLQSMGYMPGGSPRIQVGEANEVLKLQEVIDKRLGLSELSDSKRYGATGGKLLDENKKFADKVLAAFDREHAHELHAEHKMLAGGDGLVSDVSVPVAWERTVIREALYRLVGLQFVDVGTVEFATSYMIPYSYRDTAAAGRNSTRRYEGQSISRAGVIQTAETAYNVPQKLAFEISDELRYLTGARHINWEALSENTLNATRIIGEDTEQLIFNEILHASDEYGAVANSAEDLELQADGTDKVFILANFPVVRPRAVYDLQGNQVGSTVNPITVTYNSVARAEYDGTGTQAAGIYYVLNYNLGEIYLVDEAGAIQTPANAVPYTIVYSHATNVYAFNTDPGAVAIDAHWDTFLYRYGLRKSVIEDQRYHMANFGLMSGTAMTQVEQAKQFGANSKRPGTDLALDGNLGRVKDIANFKATAPALWMGDQRAIIGERGQTRLRMAKPWTLGELENQKDANGRFTGKKEAYGDQFLVCHTPTQLKRAYTSIVLYSAAARIARVNP